MPDLDERGRFDHLAPRLEVGVDPRAQLEPLRRRPGVIGGPPLPAALPVVNVTAYRQVDDPDDSASIVRAAAAAMEHDVPIVYFPSGEYLVGGDPVGAVIRGATGLTFMGEGDCSTLKRIDLADVDDFESAGGMLYFGDCHDITITHLRLDANGLQPGPAAEGAAARNLVTFDVCDRVWIEDVTVIETSHRPSGLLDDFIALDRISHHYDSGHHVAFGFSGGTDIVVVRNRLFFSGVSVHGGARRVRIAENLVFQPFGHGIAVGSSHVGEAIEDVDIRNNHVEAPLIFGIVVADIRPTAQAGELTQEFESPGFRRVRITGNTVIKSWSEYVRGIVVGRLENARGREVAPFEDIRIAANTIDLTSSDLRPLVPSDAGPDSFIAERHRLAGIWMQLPDVGEGDVAGLIASDELARSMRRNRFEALEGFERAVVVDNVVSGARYGLLRTDGAGIHAENLRRSEVGGNGIFDSDDGLVLANAAAATHVHDNRVAVLRIGYRCEDSLDGNVFIGNARLVDDVEGFGTHWVIDEGTPRVDGGDGIA